MRRIVSEPVLLFLVFITINTVTISYIHSKIKLTLKNKSTCKLAQKIGLLAGETPYDGVDHF